MYTKSKVNGIWPVEEKAMQQMMSYCWFELSYFESYPSCSFNGQMSRILSEIPRSQRSEKDSAMSPEYRELSPLDQNKIKHQVKGQQRKHCKSHCEAIIWILDKIS